MRQVSWRRWGRGWTKTNRKWANSNSAPRLFQRSAQLSISFISQNIDLAGASAPPARQPPTHPEVRGRRGDIGMVGKPQLWDFTCEMWHFCVETLRSESFFQLRGKTVFIFCKEASSAALRTAQPPPATPVCPVCRGPRGKKDRKFAAAFTPGHTGAL